MKKIIILLLTLILCLSSISCGSAAGKKEDASSDVRQFTDSLGRTVEIPAEVTSIAVTGPLTQMYVLPLCPELLAGFSKAFTSDAAKYFPEELTSLPELGQLYGGKGTMDLEALLQAAPDVVIDVGDAKDGMAEDLDKLSEQTGIPFVHIDASVTTAAEAYIMLGELTGKTEKAQQLAEWCESALKDIEELMERVDADGARKKIVYCLGEDGLHCMAEGSYHAETVNMMGDNVAKLDGVTSSGAGNEVDMEQLILWDPDVIFFDVNSAYSTVGSDPAWQMLTAVRNGEYYEVPYGPYGWLSSPPSVQRYLGFIWMAEVLYPDYTDFDLKSKVTEYYRLFYGYDLSDEEYALLTKNSF